MNTTRPPRESVVKALDEFFTHEFGPEVAFYPLGEGEDAREGCEEYIPYRLAEDGEDGWSFFVFFEDTTSYVHHDLKIEWYGTVFEPGKDMDPNEESSECRY